LRRKNTQACKPAQEVKMLCFGGLPARTFETEEVENLVARSYQRYQPQEVLRVQPKKLVVLVLVESVVQK